MLCSITDTTYIFIDPVYPQHLNVVSLQNKMDAPKCLYHCSLYTEYNAFRKYDVNKKAGSHEY